MSQRFKGGSGQTKAMLASLEKKKIDLLVALAANPLTREMSLYRQY